jgi:hypothetical protein
VDAALIHPLPVVGDQQISAVVDVELPANGSVDETHHCVVEVGTVAAGQPLRILVAGEYKLVAAVTVGAEGLSGDDPAEDVVPHVPLGGLMAVITAPQSGGRAGGQPPRERGAGPPSPAGREEVAARLLAPPPPPPGAGTKAGVQC